MATYDRRSPEGVKGRAHAQPEVAQYPLVGINLQLAIQMSSGKGNAML
jgi:hypothetical protein